MFERASNNEMSCDSLLNFCMNEMTIKEKGYLGAAFMVKAKYIRFPFQKWKFFKKGKKKLEEAISKEPNFVELRWLRYCIQYSIPSFLNYNNNQLEDKDFIIKHGNSFHKKVL